MAKRSNWTFFQDAGSWGWGKSLRLGLGNTQLTIGVGESLGHASSLLASVTLWPTCEGRIVIRRLDCFICVTRHAA